MKCDFHVHSCYSYDSTSLPELIVENAIKKGIDCLAITDHEQIKGAVEAAQYAKGKNILIIIGIEIKSRAGDILGLNIKQIIPDGLSARETMRKIRQQGGMVIIPHPFAALYPFSENIENFLNDIDGIEVLNASIFPWENKKAFNIAQEYNLCFTAGSDAHSPEFIGSVYLEIPGNNFSVSQILAAVKNKEGVLRGKESGIFKKGLAHIKRNISKIEHYARTKERKF